MLAIYFYTDTSNSAQGNAIWICHSKLEVNVFGQTLRGVNRIGDWTENLLLSRTFILADACTELLNGSARLLPITTSENPKLAPLLVAHSKRTPSCKYLPSMLWWDGSICCIADLPFLLFWTCIINPYMFPTVITIPRPFILVMFSVNKPLHMVVSLQMLREDDSGPGKESKKKEL